MGSFVLDEYLSIRIVEYSLQEWAGGKVAPAYYKRKEVLVLKVFSDIAIS